MKSRRYIDYATSRTRLINFLVDNIIFHLLSYALVFLLCMILGLAGQTQMLESLAITLQGPGGIFLSILWFLIYFTLVESIWGKTPAKFLTRTRVVDAAGGDADWMAIVGRSLCRLIPFEPFSFLFGANWHDKFSNTCVIYDR